MNQSVKRPLLLALAGIMLLTFCAAPKADAAVIFLVPAVVAGISARERVGVRGVFFWGYGRSSLKPDLPSP